MRVTDAQVRKLRQETSMGQIGRAALRAGMHRNTARRYLASGLLPSESRKPRDWRTRKDPFEDVWQEVVARLEVAPELEAKTLFDDLLDRRPGEFDPGQLRTFQRHVRDWRARQGPPKDLYFPQVHIPGEAAQTDFTWAKELGITIAGEPYEHMLCHTVLPYSDWSWATPCRSESMLALKEGVQTALGRLGRAPEWHQTDNSTAATHGVGGGERPFNEEYLALVGHYGMKPRTIEVGESNQNGDVEAANGALKRCLEQHLLLRGSRDFSDREAYLAWLGTVLEKRNALRATRLAEELAVMRPLPVHRLPAWSPVDTRVGPSGTMRVKKNTYSVPSRLRGERVQVRVFDDHLDVYHGGSFQFALERVRGKKAHRIEYRHVIDSLLKKPGAFRRYRYFGEMFPREVFREAFDKLDAGMSRWKADVHYLRILHLAAKTMETEVAGALRAVLDAGGIPTFEAVEAKAAPREVTPPALAIPAVDLTGYDALLGAAEEVAA